MVYQENGPKKDEVMDYSRFLERERKEEVPKKKKKFSFGSFIDSFKDFWAETDKKTKIELIVLLVAIVLVVAVLIFYFSQPKGSEILPLPLPAEY